MKSVHALLNEVLSEVHRTYVEGTFRDVLMRPLLNCLLMNTMRCYAILHRVFQRRLEKPRCLEVVTSSRNKPSVASSLSGQLSLENQKCCWHNVRGSVASADVTWPISQLAVPGAFSCGARHAAMEAGVACCESGLSPPCILLNSPRAQLSDCKV